MAKIFDSASELIDKGVKLTSELMGKAGEAATGAFAKGKDVAGDIAGNAGEFVGKGKVKAKLFDNSLEHDRLMRELGSAVYDQVKCDPEYVDANKSLFERIALNIEARQDLEDELYDIEAASDAAQPVDVEPLDAAEADKADKAAEETEEKSE